MSLDRRMFLGAAAASLAAPQNAKAADNVTDAKQPQLIIAALAAIGRRGEIDEAITRDYLGYLAQSGIQSILVNGSTGEFASFSTLERKWLLEAYLKYKGRMRALAHVGATNVKDALDLVRHAQSVGVDALLVIPPYYYNQPSVEGLVRYYEPILNLADVPVLLYNIPQVSGVSITPELVQRLASHPRLWGVKDSWGKADWTAAYITTFPKLATFTGASELISGVLKQGGAGALTGNGNIFPRETQAVIDAHNQGTDTAAAQQVLDERVDLLKGFPIMPTMKHVLSRMGVVDMHLRAPLVELGVTQRAELNSRLKDAGVIS